MRTNRFFINDVFNLELHIEDGKTYTIDTVKEINIERDLESYYSENKFSIVDIVVDLDLSNAILNGDFNNSKVHISGSTVCRNLDDGYDYRVNLNIENTKMLNYGLPLYSGRVNEVTLDFGFIGLKDSKPIMTVGERVVD